MCVRESFTDNQKVTEGGNHNALSADTAPGRTGSSIDGEYSTPTLRLAIWPARERERWIAVTMGFNGRSAILRCIF